MQLPVFSDCSCFLFRQGKIGIQDIVLFTVCNFVFHNQSPLFSENAVEGIGGKLVGFGDGVYVDIGCVNIAVPQPHGKGFDVASIGKKHGGTGMSQTVKFQVPDAVPL